VLTITKDDEMDGSCELWEIMEMYTSASRKSCRREIT